MPMPDGLKNLVSLPIATQDHGKGIKLIIRIMEKSCVTTYSYSRPCMSCSYENTYDQC